jgi:hypothetical protein
LLEQIFEPPTIHEIREWTDTELHEKKVDRHTSPASLSLIEAEIRRRDAWAAPAGKAFWISCAALALSVISLVFTALK